ncbi:FAD dependent oxidoreductase-like protein [Zopfia rhizophila CBS 207.26]|uniref:FAD dependent oxidoreductase-like protein n=1 Tax=Zopfia rhizophila CBS 207.26 TaxID=1314779 RepID=A0A6A6DS80_9PEZI|nr:FAD dependent oxidoreductase-like protein [Zopfia rhizophila CBS 207.26]
MEACGRMPVTSPIPNPLPSYWHNPKSPLANHREPSLPQECDYLIIGSGISGTLVAHNLLNVFPSAHIVMLEARDACGGATGRNGGHTKAASYRTYLQHRKDLGKEEALKIVRLEYKNILETHRVAREMGIDCESQVCNTVDIVYDHETFDEGKEAIETLKADASEEERKEGGMAWYKIHGQDETMPKFWVGSKNENPAVKGEEKVAGAFEYLAGRISAYRFSTGVLESCVERGLKLWTNTPVLSITSVVKKLGILTPWREVTTSRGLVRAANVILATNGYTANLLSTLQSKIVPLRGQVTAQRPGNFAKFPTPLPTTYSFIYKNGYEYMIPRPLTNGPQHIVIGGGLGRLPAGGATQYGTCDDSTLNLEISKYLRGSLVGYFGRENWGEKDGNEDELRRVVQEWTGIMGATADGRPFVGEMPDTEGLWISAGFNGHGMVQCLKCAEALVHIIKGHILEDIKWFPRSFLISAERIDGSTFRGRTDIKVPETREEAVPKGKL